ncbi:uncharacterized protein LOC144477476 isoform X2 [Augochlora pura]
MRAEETNDFSLAVTSFYLKLTGLWSAVTPTEERERRKAFRVTITVMFIGWLIVLREIQQCIRIKSFEETIFALCNLVTVMIVLCKMCVLYAKKQEFTVLLGYLEKHFWHTNYDAFERTLLEQCKKLCIIIICLFNFLAQMTSFSYVIEPVVVYFDKSVSVKKLPIELYIDFLMKPYVYEITLILQYRISNITSQINTEKRSAAPESVADCTADNCYNKFKECIRQHQGLLAYYKEVDRVFAIIVFVEILLFSIMLCLDGYLMFLEASPYRRMVFSIHISGSIFQLLMFTYSCDCVLQESTQVADAIFSIEWPLLPMNDSGKMLRSDMLLVLMRSREPCCLTAGGFFTVSLETYTKVLSTAVSYFTLLREY